MLLVLVDEAFIIVVVVVIDDVGVADDVQEKGREMKCVTKPNSRLLGVFYQL
jgi:hypothetical protein